MNKLISVILLITVGIGCTDKNLDQNSKGPKLVVGIVVDQMRYDYLTRFESKYGENGFKRLISEGFNCKEHHFSYMPTYTGPGHASVFTGTTPKTHGIIANDWYDQDLKRYVYCVEDTSVVSVGGDFVKGNRSPRNLIVTGLADQIKLHTGQKGKSIGISIKDRAAVLPAGKMADAAYWFKRGQEGLFISSSYYMKQLPDWVSQFNAQGLPRKYLDQNWVTLLPIEQYTESNPDDSPYEESIDPKGKPVFPYDLNRLFTELGFDLIKETPFGNNLLVDFAKEAILQESLGKDDILDFLSISFSSPDYIGHNYGPKSVEIEDTYIRLDQSIAELLMFLDQEVGAGEYTVFLTADHGVAQIPNELIDQGVEVGYYTSKKMKKWMNTTLFDQYGVDELVENFSNYQFFIDDDKLDSMGVDMSEISNVILNEALKYPGVKSGIVRSDLMSQSYSYGVNKKVQQGWNTKRSGDVAIIMEPGWLSSTYEIKGGSGHGSPWSYDTHVPLLFYGYGVEKGVSSGLTNVEDIVPTIATILGVQTPMGCSGVPISEVIK
ncbi:MAG: putative AlkP superfamily pyrophosphatase or phosphodiesterase [Salibacteraceae bacterium]|jgi:predicted AlkP superfamily pyrophosphatase or phosphodiesterase